MTIFDRFRNLCFLTTTCTNALPAQINFQQASSSTSIAAANISRDNPAVASTSRSIFSLTPGAYSPSKKYKIATLIDFAQSEARYTGNMSSLAQELATSLSTQKLSQRQRFEVSEALARILPPGITVSYLGYPRGDSYFAGLAVDTFLADKKMVSSPSLQTKFIAVLDRWLNVIAPDRVEFSIQGANLKRLDVNNWLQSLRNPAVCQPTENENDRMHSRRQKASSRMGRLMYGQQGNRNQSVHETAIKSIGAKVLHNLKKELRRTDLTPINGLRSEVITFAKLNNTDTEVRTGLDHIFRHIETPTVNSEVNTTPILALQALWSYSKQHNDAKVRENLMHATRLCITEIGQEKPCSTGCVERILNVPNGIDPLISMIETDVHYADEVNRLAARVQSDISRIFEGTELENPDAIEGLDEDTLGEVRASIFKRTAEAEFRLVRDVPESQFAREVERLVPGFKV